MKTNRPFVAYPSRLKQAGLLLLTIAMVATCFFCTTLPRWDAQVAGWCGIVFFGLGLFILPYRMFQAETAAITIDDQGIHSNSKLGLIVWEDIVSCRVDAIHSNRFLSIFVRDPEKYLARLPALQRKSAITQRYLGLSEITLNFISLSPGLDEACQYLRERGIEIRN
jgi:hypothetical protein